ncbi:MAG: AMP-binding protein [Acidimicrobiia bacterium]|nr:AMP-binding protein [Acidimicrobiia bacterium]
MALLTPESSRAEVGPATSTVASLARDWAQRAPHQVAMREKDFGVWREYSWDDTWNLILDAAHGLLALGVDVGDRVSIHAEDRPEWVVLDLATVAVRGVTVGLYPTNPAAEVEYLLTDSGAAVHLAEDQEQVDKALAPPAATFPALKTVIYLEPRGLRTYDDERLMSWASFLELGAAHRAEHVGDVERRMAAAEPTDIMTLVYTSGTTGPPKGAMLTNANAAFAVDVLVHNGARTPNGKPPDSDDLIVTYLPLCHIAERVFSTWHLVGCGTVLNFAESIDTIVTNLREVQPTLFFAVPRIWEKLHAGVLIRANDATWVKKRFLNFGLRQAAKVGKAMVANGGNHTFGSRLRYAIASPLVLRALKERIGLRRCRYAGSGAAPIAPEVLEFFMGIGVPVFELYGMTENTAIATANLPGRMKLGTVGEPYQGIGLRLDPETGEIQTKHPGTFAGYWGQPDATAATMTEDGWLMTGDVGQWVDDTHIKIVDRIKHIIITSGGKNVSPSEIENSLKTSPYVKEAMVIGDGRKYLAALIGIEYDTVGDWALRRNLPYTTYRDLSEKPEVVELVHGVVTATNDKFASVEQIKRFKLIPKELDHEDGELTATQKLKRGAMTEMFGDLVESMYQ